MLKTSAISNRKLSAQRLSFIFLYFIFFESSKVPYQFNRSSPCSVVAHCWEGCSCNSCKLPSNQCMPMPAHDWHPDPQFAAKDLHLFPSSPLSPEGKYNPVTDESTPCPVCISELNLETSLTRLCFKNLLIQMVKKQTKRCNEAPCWPIQESILFYSEMTMNIDYSNLQIHIHLSLSLESLLFILFFLLYYINRLGKINLANNGISLRWSTPKDNNQCLQDVTQQP